LGVGVLGLGVTGYGSKGNTKGAATGHGALRQYGSGSEPGIGFAYELGIPTARCPERLILTAVAVLPLRPQHFVYFVFRPV